MIAELGDNERIYPFKIKTSIPAVTKNDVEDKRLRGYIELKRYIKRRLVTMR